MITSECVICWQEVTRCGFVAGKTCSRYCAAELRCRTKPVGKEWLEEKYLREGLGTTQIGRLVGRHPKRVYEWLISFNIPLRKKWGGNVPKGKPFHDQEWLREEYVSKGRRLKDIATECGACESTLVKYLRKFGIQARAPITSAQLSGTAPDLCGAKNGMFGMRGPLSPAWKGGCSPERQAFYSSEEWATAVKIVWKRDEAKCQRCGRKKKSKAEKYCIHHLVTFAVKELRAVPTNLILFCDECHKWVHSNANADHEFIREPPS